jgi:RIO-like serine/threonine protein kinase
MFPADVPRKLSEWAEHSLATGENVLATSNQGTILLYREGGDSLVVKTAMGGRAMRRARQATLLREAEAYRRMAGIGGVPRCLGLVADRYLVLEHVAGVPYRDAAIADREQWFADLLAVIRAFHDSGVAHGDLKSKSNLLARDDGRPCVVDFGTTVLLKPGFHPLNRRMFEYLKRLDLNAWVKHKYHGRYEDVSEQDRSLLNYSLFESLLRKYRNRNLD